MKKRALALAAALCLLPPSAFAQGPAPAAHPGAAAGSASEADAHFRRGVELYKEADYATALIEFRRAYEIDPRYQALYDIGETYDQLQDYASALKTFERYLHDGGPQISAGRRDEVQKEIDKLRTRVASVEVTVNVADVEIAVDDVPVGRSPLAAPLVVSAGRRKISATRAGKPPVTQLLELAGGDSKRLSLVVPDDGAPVSPAPSGKVPAAPWVVTGVLTAGAIVTGALALGASSSLKDKLNVYPNASPSDISSAHSTTFAFALTTDILIGAAVVAGGISIYFTATAGSRGDPPAGPRAAWISPFSPPPRPSGASVRIEAGPESARLSGTF
jgi:hypothetical protein